MTAATPTTPPVAEPPKPPAAEANGQLIVALATVTGLVGLGIGCIVAAIILKSAEAWVAAGSIIGILGNSLTAPSGIGSVIRAGIAAKTDVSS